MGYADQPPFTPLITAGAVTLLGLSPLAIRILPALVVGVVIVMTARIAALVASGHNGWWTWGPPPDHRTTTVVVVGRIGSPFVQ